MARKAKVNRQYDRTASQYDVALALSVSERTVFNWRQRGCPYTKLCNQRVVMCVQEVKDWLHTQGESFG